MSGISYLKDYISRGEEIRKWTQDFQAWIFSFAE